MPLLNYTTEIPAAKSLGEISTLLQLGGAQAVLMEYDDARRVASISFRLHVVPFGLVSYQLPANVSAVQATIQKQVQEETRLIQRRTIRKRRIPLALFNNREQCERIAWRIVKDWLEAQLALVQIGNARLDQVMLPFAVDGSGETLYQRLVNRGSLALPAHVSDQS